MVITTKILLYYRSGKLLGKHRTFEVYVKNSQLEIFNLFRQSLKKRGLNRSEVILRLIGDYLANEIPKEESGTLKMTIDTEHGTKNFIYRSIGDSIPSVVLLEFSSNAQKM